MSSNSDSTSISPITTCSDESDFEYSQLSNLYEKDQDSCQCNVGSKNHAVITLVLGFVFFPIWFSGCIFCCRHNKKLNDQVQLLYISQLFLLLAVTMCGFCLLVSSNLFQDAISKEISQAEQSFINH